MPDEITVSTWRYERRAEEARPLLACAMPLIEHSSDSQVAYKLASQLMKEIGSQRLLPRSGIGQ
jgi:hypothetical protein